MMLLHVGNDVRVHLIAGDADGPARHNSAQRDHGHFGRTPADVNDHAPGWLSNRQSGTDGGGHRLLNEPRFTSARIDGGVMHGAAFDFSHARWDTNHDTRARNDGELLVNLLNEITKHLLGHVEIADDTVLKRSHSHDVRGCPSYHALGFRTHRENPLGAGIHGYDGGLIDDDSFATH